MSLSINDRVLYADDGTRIAYRVEGRGPALVLTNGLTTTTTFWKYIRPIWLQRYRVVTWDLPGHGNSGPAIEDGSASVEALPRFIAQIMRAAGIERAVQIGWSTGTQVALEMARQYPERCERLVLILGGAEHALSGTRLPVSGPSIERLARRLPPAVFGTTCHVLSSAFRTPAARHIGRFLGVIGPRVTPRDVQEITAHIASLDWFTLQRLTRAFELHSGLDVLASWPLPSLIVAGDADPFAPTELVGAPLHRLMPGSVLECLPEGTHTAMLEEPQHIATVVQRFLERSADRQTPR